MLLAEGESADHLLSVYRRHCRRRGRIGIFHCACIIIACVRICCVPNYFKKNTLIAYQQYERVTL
jgi:hypothetical protein